MSRDFYTYRRLYCTVVRIYHVSGNLLYVMNGGSNELQVTDGTYNMPRWPNISDTWDFPGVRGLFEVTLDLSADTDLWCNQGPIQRAGVPTGDSLGALLEPFRGGKGPYKGDKFLPSVRQVSRQRKSWSWLLYVIAHIMNDCYLIMRQKYASLGRRGGLVWFLNWYLDSRWRPTRWFWKKKCKGERFRGAQ